MILRWVNQKSIYRGKLRKGGRGLGQFADLKGIGWGDLAKNGVVDTPVYIMNH